MTEKANAPGLNERLTASGITVMMQCGDDIEQSLVYSDPDAAQVIIDGWAVADSIALVSAKVSAHAKALRDRVIANVSPGEMASWPVKLSEAANFAATGDDSQTPMLKAEAMARGITVAALVTKVGGNAAVFTALEAAIGGTDGKHRDALKLCQSFDEVAAYDWSIGWPEV